MFQAAPPPSNVWVTARHMQFALGRTIVGRRGWGDLGVDMLTQVGRLDVRLMGMSPPPIPPDVAAAFDASPPAARERLAQLRALIFETAAATPGVGALTGTLKWGEPAYLTEASKSGNTIRLGVAKDGRCALYLNCKTTLVGEYRAAFSDVLGFEGNRAVLLDPDAPLPGQALVQAVAMALTYHSRKRRAA